jgi:putative resolvase
MSYVASRIAIKRLGFHPNTLRKLADEGKIDHIKISGQRRYNVEKYIQENGILDESSEEDELDNKPQKICYCRVSSKKQAADLSRQIKFIQSKYKKHRVISDVGSSLNFKRPGLQEILDLAMQKNLKEVVVAYKDRLARIGFDLIQQIIEKNGGRLVVLNKNDVSKETELAEDIISIITVYSARYYGSRKYKNTVDKDKSESDNDEDSETSENN